VRDNLELGHIKVYFGKKCVQGKVGGAFTSVGGRKRGYGGHEAILQSFHATFLQHGMVTPPPPTHTHTPTTTTPMCSPMKPVLAIVSIDWLRNCALEYNKSTLIAYCKDCRTFTARLLDQLSSCLVLSAEQNYAVALNP